MVDRAYFRDMRAFLTAWMRAPRRIGAIAPSSHELARLMTANIAPCAVPVLEFGAGTGVFTRALLARGIRECDLILIEAEPKLARLLRLKFPQARVICTDAARLGKLLSGEKVGVVVSGLPLLAMSQRQVWAILRAAIACMRPGAAIYQFTYGRRCPVARPMLERLGLRAQRVGSVLANVPPATVYRITVRRRLATPDAAIMPLSEHFGSAHRRQHSRIIPLAAALLLSAAMAACGAGNSATQDECSRDPDSDLPVCGLDLAPVSAITSRLSQVALQGNAKNFHHGAPQWWVNESLIQDKLDCAFSSLDKASFQSCPFGYVVYNSQQPPYTATYYASTNTGTFHIALQADPGDGYGPIQVISTITVEY